jgi:hypothetical protein
MQWLLCQRRALALFWSPGQGPVTVEKTTVPMPMSL